MENISDPLVRRSLAATCLEKRLAKSCPPHIFVNKVLPEHSHTYLFTLYGCFHTAIALYWSGQEKKKKKLKYLPFGPLPKKFANTRVSGIATELEMRELDSIPNSDTVGRNKSTICMNY